MRGRADEWTVHVMGPDDILPAASWDDAVKQANEINNNLPPRPSEHYPYLFAVPCRKGTYAYPNDGERVLS